MLSQVLLRLAAEAGPGAHWIVVFLAAVITAFVLYIGVAMLATFVAKDQAQGEIRYRIFSDLLGLFSRRRRG
jgi:hypothetical protein